MEYVDQFKKVIEVEGNGFTVDGISSYFNTREELDAWLAVNGYALVPPKRTSSTKTRAVVDADDS
jgi:hypothetical protein